MQCFFVFSSAENGSVFKPSGLKFRFKPMDVNPTGGLKHGVIGYFSNNHKLILIVTSLISTFTLLFIIYHSPFKFLQDMKY